jgi:hypothetical protein
MLHRALAPSVRAISLLIATLAAAPAGAAEYRVTRGEVLLTATGARQDLEGWLDLVPLPVIPEFPELDSYLLEDFALAVGELGLRPAIPIEFDGLVPILYLRFADALQREGRGVIFFRLRAGGDLVAADDQTVTFRFHELRGERGATRGRPRPGGFPAGFRVDGVLVEVEETFAVHREPCEVWPPAAPGDGGGGVVIGAMAPPQPPALAGLFNPFCPGLLLAHPPSEQEVGRFRIDAARVRSRTAAGERGHGSLLEGLPGGRRRDASLDRRQVELRRDRSLE